MKSEGELLRAANLRGRFAGSAYSGNPLRRLENEQIEESDGPCSNSM